MENREKLENALGEYVLCYNHVIHMVEQEMKNVVSADFYDSNCTIQKIKQIAYHKKRGDSYFELSHDSLPDPCWADLHGQGFRVIFLNGNNGKTKSLTFIFDCILNRWKIEHDIEFRYYLDDIFETSYLDMFYKLSSMLKKQYNTAGEQYNEKVTKLETLMSTIFNHHQTIIQLNK